MKKLITLVSSFLFLGAINVSAQVFWTERFDTASTGLVVSSYISTNGAWSLSVTGAEGSHPNPWYVSCEETGHIAGICGTTCTSSMGSGETLHVGADLTTTGDNGAAYDVGGFCGTGSCPQTDRRAESPTINCSGKANIRLKFYYILNGQGTSDDGSIYYSPDNGVSWSLLLHPPKTPTTCAPQGTWDSIAVWLPPSANNNPTVKIGFRWVNNDDGVGSNPSFAVDNISLGNYIFEVMFDYDNVGNRILRKIELICIGCPKPGLQDTLANDNTLPGINVLNEKIAIEAYPNPTESDLFIDNHTWKQTDNVVVIVSDMLGKTIIKKQFTQAKESIPLTGLTPGTYVVHYYLNALPTKVWKIIKM